MTFNSLAFLVFCPIVLLLYFTLPKKLKPVMLLLASWYFYMSFKPELIFLILFTTAVSYFSGIFTEKTKSKGIKKLLLTLTLVSSLGVLFFFKYFNFLSGSIFALFGQDNDLALSLVLPVGISFYTFQTLSYAIDVYRGKIAAEKSFLYYALFVSFFPQLVAGPIERPENLLPQLHEAHKFTADNFSEGISKMAVGFFKKIVVADMLSPYVNSVFNNPRDSHGFGIILASILFAFQIYCDFSGYTDIAIGTAKIMGINLMQNFKLPYSATGIKDFWARWHISLTSWFKDYLYIPLGGNRKGYTRTLINVFIVFVLSGLWHGAKWTFVLWGALHGLYQIIGRLTEKARSNAYKKLKIDENGKFAKVFKRAVTFILVCFAWIFFRANSTDELFILLKNLFTSFDFSASLSQMGINIPAAALITVSLLSLFLLDKLFTFENGKGKRFSADGIIYLAWAIIFALLLLEQNNLASAFIYFQF